MKRILTATVALAAVLGLTACAPTLEARAQSAGETIGRVLDQRQEAQDKIAADQAELQAKVDAADAEFEKASAPYFEGETDEMLQLQEENERLYEAAEAADEEFWNVDWSNDTLYNAAEEKAQAAWDAYYANSDEIAALEKTYEEQYEEASKVHSETVAPLQDEISRLDEMMTAAAFDEDIVGMAFAVMASCPELSAASEEGDATEDWDTVMSSDVEWTETCVTTLETWAAKLGEKA
jgi:hypothetical protein